MSEKYWDKAWSLMALNKRFGKWPEKVTPRFDRLEIPLHVKKPTVWSVWNDLFHEDVPDKFIEQVFNRFRRQ